MNQASPLFQLAIFVKFFVLKTKLLLHLYSLLPPEETMAVEFSAKALPSMFRIIKDIGPSSLLGVKVYVLSDG